MMAAGRPATHTITMDLRKGTALPENIPDALFIVMPDGSPGLTVSEAKAALLPILPDTPFPGEKAGWWLKAAQLDLETKGIIRRAHTKPIRLHRT